jgi:hypothetical protein
MLLIHFEWSYMSVLVAVNSIKERGTVCRLALRRSGEIDCKIG